MTVAPRAFATPTPLSTRKKRARTRTGHAHSNVPSSAWNRTSKSTALPPLRYDRGPFTLTLPDYVWNMHAIRGGESRLMTEVETVTWDDASAVLTGSLTFHTPEWAQSLDLREGDRVRASWSDDGGVNFTPCWTMRIAQPNSDLGTRTRTWNLVSDLNRLAQSNDDFVYAAGKDHKGGWRVDEIIHAICDQYGIVVQSCPVMTTKIKKWHLRNQAPIDVIHSALIREKNKTGRRYAVSMDWQERLWVKPFSRPRSLLEIGPQIIAATGSTQLDPRFATALTVRTGYGVKVVVLDKKGHKKPQFKDLAVNVPSRAGISQYGYVHRNVYSPDANSNDQAAKEGKLFLAAVAKPKRSFTVTLPGVPWLARLDAFHVVIPSEGISQIVYVSDARHNLDAGSGYTVESVLDFQDPFGDDRTLKILDKLSDVAVARRRKPPAVKPTKPATTSKTKRAHSASLLGTKTPLNAAKATTRK